MGISEISSTAALRVALRSQDESSAPADATREPVGATRKVDSAPDGPGSYSAAIQLHHYAQDIAQLRKGMSEAIQIIRAADSGIVGLRRVLETMNALLNDAGNSSEPALKARYARAYDELYAQLNLLAANGARPGAGLPGESDADLLRWMPDHLPVLEAALDEEAAGALLLDSRQQLSGTPLSLARRSFRALSQMLD